MTLMTDYELLDFGNGRKLERFGRVVLDRPCLAAERCCPENPAIWNRADSRFLLSPQKAERGYWTTEMESWTVRLGTIFLELRCTPFGHIGVFPEQQTNWQQITGRIAEASQKRTKTIRVLNLFAYTGGSSLAAAQAATPATPVIPAANIETVHVDSAKNVVDWAKRNAKRNNIQTIRFIVDDVRKFVRRELKRNLRYDAVILDPPSYGHGLKGEAWKLTEHLPALLADVAGLLSDEPLFVILTAHSSELTPDAVQKMFRQSNILRNKNFRMENIFMNIHVTETKNGAKYLPSGYGVFLFPVRNGMLVEKPQ
jgi:23S rRNA (cytosine1962-C5)-methyltransferase